MLSEHILPLFFHKQRFYLKGKAYQEWMGIFSFLN